LVLERSQTSLKVWQLHRKPPITTSRPFLMSTNKNAGDAPSATAEKYFIPYSESSI